MKRYWTRVTKRDWYLNGGFANSRCVRKHQRNRGWTYWMVDA